MTEVLLLVTAAALVLACGVFVAAEFSFVTVDRATVDRAADGAADRGSRSAEGVRRALRSLSTQLSGAQVGITVTNLAIGYLAEPAIARLVDGPLEAIGVPPGAVRPTAVTLGLVLATAATMVFGELVPKNLAIARPLRVAQLTQGPQRLFTSVMAWPIRLLNGSANAVVRSLGIEPQEELRSARNSEELSSLIRRSADEGKLDTPTADLMQRSVRFGDRTAGEIMTPRVRMHALPANATALDVVAAARTTGRSRFPVVVGDDDNVVGAVHVKSAVGMDIEERRRTRVRALMVEPTVVPETLRLDPLLALLRRDGFQMATVVDEYGGTAGVVTLEDVVEEMVGDIADEHDPMGARARRRPDGSWTLSGLLRPDEVAEVSGVELPTHDDYDTVAGLFLKLLGRLPGSGDEVVVPLPIRVDDTGRPQPPEEAVLVVERMEGRRIDRLRLRIRRSTGSEQAGAPHE